MEKRQTGMPALAAAVTEMDGPLAEAGKGVDMAAAVVAAAESEAAARQAEVEAVVRELLLFQGITPPAPAPQ